MYIRFVIAKKDEDSGRRQGLFQALSVLDDSDKLLPDEKAQFDAIYTWFRSNLGKPRSFSRLSKSHAKNVAISWFKDSATSHISQMRELAAILCVHGIATEILKTERPGYIVY